MTLLLATAVVAFVLAGFAQSVSGFGSALVAVPLIALVVDPVVAVVAVTAVSAVIAGSGAVRERRHADVRVARRLLVTGLLGMPLGLAVLALAPAAALTALMAVSLVVAIVLVGAGVRIPAGHGPADACGMLSGVLLTSTGMNGPPLVVAADAHCPEPRRLRGTLQIVLFGQDTAAVLGFLALGRLSSAALVVAVVGVVVSPMGWWLGDRVFHRLDARAFRRVLLAGLAASALTLLLGSLH